MVGIFPLREVSKGCRTQAVTNLKKKKSQWLEERVASTSPSGGPGAGTLWTSLMCLGRYAGPMERAGAESILTNRSDGTFLVRQRVKDAAEFAISIK